MENNQGIRLDIKQGVITHQRNHQTMTIMMIMIIVIKKTILQIIHLINPTPTTSFIPNQNMNDGNGGENNPPDRGQNNIIAQALTALAQVLGNMQPAPTQASREQNIA